MFSMLSLGRTLISDLVVANQFMHSLPDMILLYLAAPFYYTEGVFECGVITFVRFVHCYRSRITDSHIVSYPGRSLSEDT